MSLSFFLIFFLVHFFSLKFVKLPICLLGCMNHEQCACDICVIPCPFHYVAVFSCSQIWARVMQIRTRPSASGLPLSRPAPWGWKKGGQNGGREKASSCLNPPFWFLFGAWEKWATKMVACKYGGQSRKNNNRMFPKWILVCITAPYICIWCEEKIV